MSKGESEGAFKIEWKEVNLRLLSRNRFPNAVIFETENLLLAFIGKLSAAYTFDDHRRKIIRQFPMLDEWLGKRALVVLKHQKEWPRLLAVMKYIKDNPRPGIYLRQLDIPEVDTKFIEKHKKLLSELLDLMLPQDVIDNRAKGLSGFEQRYGFFAKPVQVRFRILDPEQYLHGLSDLQVPVSEFSKLNLDVDQIFITENDINGLAFLDVKRAIIIFGLGFGLDRLASVEWLHDKKMYYWGDIDTHGYVMLDQLRCYFPHVSSFLMERKTLLAHRSLWGREGSPSKRELKHLAAHEQEVYELLRDNVLADSLRLEQERISFSLILDTVEDLTPAKHGDKYLETDYFLSKKQENSL